MLFYKAWRESRARFLICAGIALVFCVSFLVRARTDFPVPQNPRIPYTGFVWANIFGGVVLGGNAIAFSYMSLLLGLGGLQRERAGGTAVFTLGLPVTRRRLVGARAAVGLLQMASIAVIPAVILPALSPVITGRPYSIAQAMSFASLYLAWGAVWYAVGLCWSTFLAAEFAAVIACVLTPVSYTIALAKLTSSLGAPMDPAAPGTASFAYYMSGLSKIWPPNSGVFAGPLPWTSFAVLGAAALALVAAAALVTARQDF
jgi:ABC-type transport system involved in multi-copper enzyme maturation permease subunit